MPNKAHMWLKCHAIIGVKTNVITAVIIDDEFCGDSEKFIPLVKQTHENGFAIREISADKAYSSRKNMKYVESIGAMSYVPFKDSTTGNSSELLRAKALSFM